LDTCAFGPKESLVDSRWYLVKEIRMSWLDGETVKRHGEAKVHKSIRRKGKKKKGGEKPALLIGNLLELAGPEVVDELLPLFRGVSGSYFSVFKPKLFQPVG
jgi:hypothetical protein